MALSKQSRNIIIGGAAAIIVVAILAFLFGRSCEEEKPTTTRTTPTATSTTRTTPTAPATVTVEVTTPAPEPEPAPAPAPSPPPEIISRSVVPDVADPGDALAFSAEIQGTATSATMTVFQVSSGTLALTLPLVQGATIGNVTTWSNTAAAPATKGVYKYFASAAAADGSIVEMPGTSGWTFCVGDPMVDCT